MKHNNVIKWLLLTTNAPAIPSAALHTCAQLLSCDISHNSVPLVTLSVSLHLAHSLPAPLSVPSQLDPTEDRRLLVSGMNHSAAHQQLWCSSSSWSASVLGIKGLSLPLKCSGGVSKGQTQLRLILSYFFLFCCWLNAQPSEPSKHEENADDDDAPGCAVRVSERVFILLLLSHRRPKYSENSFWRSH